MPLFIKGSQGPWVIEMLWWLVHIRRKCGSCSKMLIWDFWLWYAKHCSRHCQVWSIHVINSLLEKRNTSSNDSICARNHIFFMSKANKQVIDDALTRCNWWGHMMESITGEGRVALVWGSRSKTCEDPLLCKMRNSIQNHWLMLQPNVLLWRLACKRSCCSLCWLVRFSLRQGFIFLISPQALPYKHTYFNIFLWFFLLWFFISLFILRLFSYQRGLFGFSNSLSPQAFISCVNHCRIILCFLPGMPLLALLSDNLIFQGSAQIVPALWTSSLIDSDRGWSPSL